MIDLIDLPKGLTEEKLTELKSEHGELNLIRHPEDNFPRVIVKKVAKSEYSRFKSELGNDRKAVSEKALEGLLKRHVVYPPRDEFESILEDYPALADTYGKKLLALAGMSEDVDAKKL
jgi:hypothetical protein